MIQSDACHCVRLKPCAQGLCMAWVLSWIQRVTQAVGSHCSIVPHCPHITRTQLQNQVRGPITPIITIFNHNVPLFLLLLDDSPDS